jgi:general secretion pathway protein L
MQIGVGLIFQWFAILASIIEDLGQWRRARRSLVIKKQADSFVIEQVSDGGTASIVEIPQGSVLPKEVAHRLRNHTIDFELGGSEVVARRLTVPSQAKDVLPGIVRNQIERLSPWPFAKTIYGFAPVKNEANRQSLDVWVLMTSQRTIDGLRDRLAASDLSPHRIVARSGGDQEALALWTRASGRESSVRANAPRLIAAAFAAFVLLSASVTAWALIDASAVWEQHDDAAARARSLRQNSASSSAATPAAGSGSQGARAWTMKENTPAAVMIIDALARALPDNAYLTDLNLEHAAVRITGLSIDPPPLINALQQSGRFTGARFFAATTKDLEKGGYRFNIEAQAAPPTKSTGD